MTKQKPANLPNDIEPFTTRDHITRRKTYSKCDEHVLEKLKSRKLKNLTVLNFTKDDFIEGATSWYHLKDTQLQLLCHYFNGMAHAMGNKSSSSTSSTTGSGTKKRVTHAANKNVVHHDILDLYIETLFDESRQNCVYGYRFFFFEFKSSTSSSSSSSLNDQSSLLTKGIHTSFKEYHDVLARHKKNKTQKALMPPKGTEKLDLYLELDRTLKYMKNDSFVKLYLTTFSNYGNNECYRTLESSLDNNAQGLNPSYSYFIDNRELRNETEVSRIFSIDSAMVYNVINRIQVKQTNLHTYLNEEEDFPHYERDEEEEQEEESFILQDEGFSSKSNKPKEGSHHNIKVVGHTKISNCSFLGFYNQDTTYRIEPSKVLPEYIVKVPLPHLFGSTLLFKEDQVHQQQEVDINHDLFDDEESTAHLNQRTTKNDDHEDEKEREAEVEEYMDIELEDNHNDIAYGEDDDDTSGLLNEVNLKTLRYINQDHLIEEDEDENDRKPIGSATDASHYNHPQLFHNQNNKSLFIKKTPLGLQSTSFRPSDYEILTVKRSGRFANLSTSRYVTEKTVHDYKRCQEMIVETALLHSCTHTINYSSLFSGDLAKSRLIPIGTYEDQPYYTETEIQRSSQLNDEEGGGEGEDLHFSQSTSTNAEFYKYMGSFDDKNDPNTFTSKEEAKIYEKLIDEFHRYRDQESLKYDTVPKLSDTELIDACHLANGNVEMYKDIIRRYRPVENDFDTVMKVIPNPSHTEDQLKKDIFLRLFELNTKAFQILDRKYLRDNGVIKSFDEKAYRKDQKELIEALAVECFHEFMTNEDVTGPCKQVREYFQFIEQKTNEGLKVSPIECEILNLQINARPYDLYRIWLQQFYISQEGLDVRSNFKNMHTIFHARLHHCRHVMGVNGNLSPKMNILVTGEPGGGKSYQSIQALACLVPGIVEKVNQFTSNSLMFDGNMSDTILFIEELPPEFFGRPPDKNGKKQDSNSDNVAILKGILTSGESKKMRGQWDTETGQCNQVKSKAQLQIQIIATANNSIDHADPALLDRFINLHQNSVVKDGRKPILQTPLSFKAHEVSKKLVNEVIEMHRIYFIIEQMMKANVLGVNRGSGINTTVADVLVPQILDHLQLHYNIPTSNSRKRNFVIEMARTMQLHFVVWHALKSPLLHHLHYYPAIDSSKRHYVGFNMRLVTEGIFPYLFVTKDAVLDSLTTLSTLWQSDHLGDILTYITKESRSVDFLLLHDHLNEPPPGEKISLRYTRAKKVISSSSSSTLPDSTDKKDEKNEEGGGEKNDHHDDNNKEGEVHPHSDEKNQEKEEEEELVEDEEDEDEYEPIQDDDDEEGKNGVSPNDEEFINIKTRLQKELIERRKRHSLLSHDDKDRDVFYSLGARKIRKGGHNQNQIQQQQQEVNKDDKFGSSTNLVPSFRYISTIEPSGRRHVNEDEGSSSSSSSKQVFPKVAKKIGIMRNGLVKVSKMKKRIPQKMIDEKGYTTFKRDPIQQQGGDSSNEVLYDDPSGEGYKTDYNYIAYHYSTKKETLIKKIASSAANLPMSDKYVTRVFEDLAEQYTEDLPSYILNPSKGRLEYDRGSERLRRKVIEFTKSTEYTNVIYLSTHFLKNRLPHIFTDELVEDLSKLGSRDTKSKENKIKKRRKNENNEDVYDTASDYKDTIDEMVSLDRQRLEKSLQESIRFILENPALERAKTLGFDTYGKERIIISDEMDESWLKQYNATYFNHILSEPIREVTRVSNIFDDVPSMTKKEANQYDVIHFDKYLTKTVYERKHDSPLITINNKNFQTASTGSILTQSNAILNATTSQKTLFLSIKDSSKQKATSNITAPPYGITRRNKKLFTEAAIIEFTEDIDWEVMKSHFLDISIRIPTSTGDERQAYMAYPTFLYMLNTNFHQSLMKKFYELFPNGRKEGEMDPIDYPNCDVIQEIHMAHTALQHQFQLKITDTSKVLKFSTLCGSNFESGENFLLINDLKKTSSTELVNEYPLLKFHSVGLNLEEDKENERLTRQYGILMSGHSASNEIPASSRKRNRNELEEEEEIIITIESENRDNQKKKKLKRTNEEVLGNENVDTANQQQQQQQMNPSGSTDIFATLKTEQRYNPSSLSSKKTPKSTILKVKSFIDNKDTVHII